MKKVLIVSHSLNVGGAERSLIGLLWAMNNPLIKIDLFLFRHEGELMKLIPPYVNLLSEIPAYTALARPIKNVLREGHLLLSIGRMVGKAKALRYVNRHSLKENAVGLEYSHKYTYRILPEIQANIEYDTVISFLTPHYIASHKVRAKRKICWIHTDYMQVAVNQQSELRMWDAYDYIIAVSEAVKKSFLMIYPQLTNKVAVIENVLPRQLVLAQANGYDALTEMIDDGSIKILSIGRFSYPKNFDNVPDICKRLRNKGMDVTWYLLGYGPDDNLIREKIKEAKMEKHVVILGKKENPYPYIRTCDVYVQPSRYEGKSVAVREAQMLGKPVVITNYPTSKSQILDNVDGLIVPLDNESCAEGIISLIANKAKMDYLSKNCLRSDYSNCQEADKVIDLILL